ncbi:MAG: hypothetical protein ACOYXC_05175 [Candidatus Rifleibacteriota bacterium]
MTFTTDQENFHQPAAFVLASRLLSLNLWVICGLLIFNAWRNWPEIKPGPDYATAFLVVLSGAIFHGRSSAEKNSDRRLLTFLAVLGSSAIVIASFCLIYFDASLLDLPAKYDRPVIFGLFISVGLTGAGAFLPATRNRK